MLKDRIKEIFNVLGGSNRSVAVYAGIAAPNIGKLTNGSRVPSKKSSTIRKLTGGICKFAEENNKTTELCEVIGAAPEDGESRIRIKLVDWLYQDTFQPEDSKEVFSERLKEIMSLVGATIMDLGKAAGTDSVMMCNYLDGSRMPPKNSRIFDSMCEELVNISRENGTLDKLIEMIGFHPGELSSAEIPLMLRSWLRGRTSAADSFAASQLVKSMINTGYSDRKLPDPVSVAVSEITAEDTREYVGIAGLQRAVIRFLANAAKKPGSELLLYSDQSMEWMQANYTPKWTAMMNECIKNGVKIKIIHNIDRDSGELLFALQSWMPLYMTGAIEPYYRLDMSGNRFGHSVFISEDECIDGFCMIGAERDCVYRYSTSKEHADRLKDSFRRLLVKVKPLVKYEEGDFVPQKAFREYNCGEVRVFICQNEAVVFKTTEPKRVFSFKLPYLVRMFSLYGQTFNHADGEPSEKTADTGGEAQ